MPRPSRTRPTPNAIVASAARVMAGRRRNRPAGPQTWQNEAWEMLDTVGELEFYRRWKANALSRCTLEVVEVQPDGEEVPTKDPTALAALAALFGGDAGQPEMLGAMGGHISVPGETWLCGLLAPSPTPDIDTWRVLAHDEVREQGTSWVIDRGDGQPETYGPDDVYMTRIWSPHPRKYVQAHSTVRSALPILRQLVGLSKRDAANIDSRLIGNGILAVPSEITFASPSTADGSGDDLPEDPFLAALVEAGTAAIDNPGGPEALFPILVRAPAEHIAAIKHLTLATSLDEKAIQQQEKLIGRLANSLDVPAEVLLGMADVNHWTGWLLDENAIKMHVEPPLEVIAGGLTTRYLLPCLQGTAQELDPALRRFKLRGSTAALRQRPNRSVEAQAARDSITISDSAWARETGFLESDLLTPADEEFRTRILMKMAATSNVPEVVVGALAALGVTVDLPVLPVPRPVVDVPTGSNTPVQVAGPASTPAAAPDTRGDRNLPALPASGQADQAASLLAVSEVLVLRAVERGWNRAGRRGRVRKPVAAGDLDAAMSGSWDHVARAAALTGVDGALLQATLDRYSRALLTSGAEHNPTALAQMLIAEVINAPEPVGA